MPLGDEAASVGLVAGHQLAQLVHEQHEDVGGRGQHTGGRELSAQVPQGHAGLVDDADDAGLRPLAAGDERGRRPQPHLEGAERLGVAGEGLADAALEVLALGLAGRVLGRR